MPFRFHIYNFQDQQRGEAARASMDAMEADGWEPHTTSADPAQVAVLWRKPLVEDKDDEDKSEDKSAAKDRHPASRRAKTE